LLLVIIELVVFTMLACGPWLPHRAQLPQGEEAEIFSLFSFVKSNPTIIG